MLCFSAGRCRGYLHAKSLGQGGEYLSYVWLLMSYMGMETLGEKMQRTKLQEEASNIGTEAASSTVIATGGSYTGTKAAIYIDLGTTEASSPVMATGGGADDGTMAAAHSRVIYISGSGGGSATTPRQRKLRSP